MGEGIYEGLPQVGGGEAGVPEAVVAMKQGALDFLSKPVGPGALLAVVARAVQRDAAAAAERAARDEARARWAVLTLREREVCRLSARGLLNKQIAAELGTVENTAQVQRTRSLQKLQVSTLPDLIRLISLVDEEG